MVNTNLQIEIIKEGKKENIDITIQEVSPFRTVDIFSSGLNISTGRYNMGMIVEQLIDLIVLSPNPENLKEKIEEADNALSIISYLFGEFQAFCNCPRLYKLRKIEEEGKAKTKSVENGATKSNVDRSTKNE